MSSRGFRVGLRRELEEWRRDGIVSAEGAERLRARYALDTIGEETGRQTATVIFTIGALLVGGGVIAFVSAHWARLGPGARIAILLTFLLALYAAGWRASARSPRLGRGLFLAGCLVFGASLGLFGQIFHVQEDWHHMLAAWMAGTLAVAWAIRAPETGALAVLIAAGWFAARLAVVGAHGLLVPGVIALLVLPLAYRTRSAPLHVLVLLAFGTMVAALAGRSAGTPWATALQVTVMAWLTWAIGFHHRGTTSLARYSFAAPLGAVVLAIVAYLVSFRDFARMLGWHGDIDARGWLLPVALTAGLGAALAAHRWRMNRPGRVERGTAGGILAATLLTAGGVIVAGAGAADEPSKRVIAAVFGNVAAVALAVTGILAGVHEDRRGAFWLGSLFAVLLVLSRFFEYQAGLLAKSAAFLLCGVAVIRAGVAFERRLQRASAPPAPEVP
ncbi:MAG: DUF2157 domain-containing protein [bacterium]